MCNSLGPITHGLADCNEVNGNNITTLMKELEVRVLCIATCATKDYG